jgi:hypothetical protein
MQNPNPSNKSRELEQVDCRVDELEFKETVNEKFVIGPEKTLKTREPCIV